MPTEYALPKDHPLMKAWDAYRATDGYRNSFKWCADLEHRQGSMWAAFMSGWCAAREWSAALHEQVNPASDQERHNGDPGAGAMGAVIEYRDAIRSKQ